MELICTICKWTIDSANINVVTDLAKCGHCGTIHKASILAHMVDDKILATPPRGSKIELTKEIGDNILIVMPKKRVTTSDISGLFFCVFWLGFVSFWTWSALQSSILFAMFSIPFWLIGLVMLVGIINNINETQTIEVSRSSLTLIKSRPFNSNEYEYSFDDIQSIKMTHMQAGSFFGFSNLRYIQRQQRFLGAGLTTPTIITGLRTQYFFEWANDAEQEWVTKFLESKIRKSETK